MLIDKTKKTIEAYNKNARKFVDKFLTFKPYQEKLSLFQQKYLGTKAMKVLDIGCGPGHHAKYLSGLNNNLDITGIDLSPKMLELARQLAPGCTFILGDMRNLTANSKYDVVIASFCIVHLTDNELKEFIANLNRLLKSNGYLYLSFIEGDQHGFVKPDFFDDKIFINLFRQDTITKLLTDNHFTVKELYEYDYHAEAGQVTKEIFIFAQKHLRRR